MRPADNAARGYTQADRALAEAWGDYLDRHRDEIAENFERAAELIRAGDTHGLAEHVGRNRRARAEAAASDSHAARDWRKEDAVSYDPGYNSAKHHAPEPSAANEQDVYADSILSSDELRQMFMQREYTSRDVERLLISHAALINKVKWLESKP